jgi:tRNA A37 threonylcarbamoyladenosine synthetase subunit TsaC/SUA5/YrdC
LTATSANISGVPPAQSAADVESQFPEGLDLIIDGGEVIVTEPSSVLDVSGDLAKLIREGAVSRQEIESAIGSEIH